MSQKTIDNIIIWCMLIVSTIIVILILITGYCHFYKSHYRGDWKETLIDNDEPNNVEPKKI